jgi:hypothetical protein
MPRRARIGREDRPTALGDGAWQIAKSLGGEFPKLPREQPHDHALVRGALFGIL